MICVPLTSNLNLGACARKRSFSAKAAGLPKDSIASASQIIALDRALLTEHVANLSLKELAQVMSGIDVVLGR